MLKGKRRGGVFLREEEALENKLGGKEEGVKDITQVSGAIWTHKEKGRRPGAQKKSSERRSEKGRGGKVILGSACK